MIVSDGVKSDRLFIIHFRSLKAQIRGDNSQDHSLRLKSQIREVIYENGLHKFAGSFVEQKTRHPAVSKGCLPLASRIYLHPLLPACNFSIKIDFPNSNPAAGVQFLNIN